jgi:hypothetical protein
MSLTGGVKKKEIKRVVGMISGYIPATRNADVIQTRPVFFEELICCDEEERGKKPRTA